MAGPKSPKNKLLCTEQLRWACDNATDTKGLETESSRFLEAIHIHHITVLSGGQLMMNSQQSPDNSRGRVDLIGNTFVGRYGERYIFLIFEIKKADPDLSELKKQMKQRCTQFFGGSQKLVWQNQVIVGGGYGTRACYYRLSQESSGALELASFHGGVAVDGQFLNALVEEEAAEWKYILDEMRTQELKRAV